MLESVLRQAAEDLRQADVRWALLDDGHGVAAVDLGVERRGEP
jgi:hypothetical protein